MLMCQTGQELENFLQTHNIVRVKFLKELYFDFTKPERASKVTFKQKILLAQAIVFGFPSQDLIRSLFDKQTTLSEQTLYDLQFKMMKISDPLISQMVNDGGVGMFLGQDPISAQWWHEDYTKY